MGVVLKVGHTFHNLLGNPKGEVQNFQKSEIYEKGNL